MGKEILKNKNFVLLMIAKIISLMGDQLQQFALELYVLKLTGSATKFASVVVIGMIPQIILGPFVGVLVDRLDRKKIVVIGDFVNGIVIILFAIMWIMSGSISVNLIYALVFIISIITACYDPATRTMIPSVVKKEELLKANALNSSSSNIINLLAPTVGGILFVTIGLKYIVILNAISFMLATILELQINMPKMAKKSTKLNVKQFFCEFKEGISFIKANSILSKLLFLVLVINIMLSPIFSVGFPYMLKSILKVNDGQYGLFQSIEAVATLLAPVVCVVLSKRMKIGKIIEMDLIVCSIVSVIISLIISKMYIKMFNSNIIPYISLIAVAFVVVAVVSIVNIALSTLIQQVLPRDMMGRVLSVLVAGTSISIAVGQALYGILFDMFSTNIIVFISGVIMLIITCALINSFKYINKQSASYNS